MNDALDEIKVVVALRTARSALGWNQEEASQRLGIAKSTLARIETMEGGTTAGMLATLLRAYNAAGVRLDFLYEDEVKVTINSDALLEAKNRLNNETLRRSDKVPTDLKNQAVMIAQLYSITLKEATKKLKDGTISMPDVGQTTKKAWNSFNLLI